MATYQYEALDSAGKPTTGSVVAETSEDAIQQIRGQGFFPTSVRQDDGDGGGKKGLLSGRGKKGGKKAAKKGSKKKSKKKADKGEKKKGFEIKLPAIGRVKVKILTQFTRQLSTLQDAGLPLLRSLQILEQQQKPGQLKNILGHVVTDVEAGSTLSDAFAKHPRGFDRLYCKMVAAGEVGGVLDIILQRLANFMEKAQRLRSRIKGAMIYPTVVVFIAVAIVTGIMYFVIPKFEEIFGDFEIELPGLTQFLIEASAWVAGNQPEQVIPGWAVIVASPFVLMVFMKFLKKTNFGRAMIDWVVLKIPVVGVLVEKTTVARFTRTLGTLVSAGVPILEAINITRDTCGNWVFERALQRVHDSIREGESFATPLRESKVCDGIVVNMIDVGEETGDLDVMLMKVADNYDEEVDVAVQSLLSLVEPLLVVVLGSIVGGIVLALFMPLVKMIQSVSDSQS
ncbi:MAG: type II secretion system F family protein [Phycisphaerales bacterium]|jgi:type IV pilus assembly protein PilC|nr:type II secretion system F family protein [Phycisphaerales bacterium]